VQELQSIGFPNFQDTQEEDVQIVVPFKPKTKQPQKKIASKKKWWGLKKVKWMEMKIIIIIK